MKMKQLLVLFCLGLLTMGAHAQELGEANELPSVDLKTMSGRQVDLKSFVDNDKYTIISFWATWCKPCKKELDNLSYLLPEWQKEFDVELIAISVDDSRTSRKVESFVNGRGWTFDVLLDVNNNTKRELEFAAIPYSIIVNKEGKIVYKHSGYKSGDEYEMQDKLKSLEASGDDAG